MLFTHSTIIQIYGAIWGNSNKDGELTLDQVLVIFMRICPDNPMS